jgi:hypothetical protein
VDSVDGKSQKVPKVIQQLYRQRLQFEQNSKNITLGMVKTFVLDDMLEMWYLDDKQKRQFSILSI